MGKGVAIMGKQHFNVGSLERKVILVYESENPLPKVPATKRCFPRFVSQGRTPPHRAPVHLHISDHRQPAVTEEDM